MPAVPVIWDAPGRLDGPEEANVIRRTLLATFVTLAALQATPAAAQSRYASGRGTQILSVWGVLDPGPVDGAGVGVRFMLPIAPHGVIRGSTVRDEFTLEFGADFVHYSDHVGPYGPYPYVGYSWNGFLPVVGATWNFWLTPAFALYPKLDLGYWVGSYSGWVDQYGYARHDFDGFFIQGAVGMMFRLQSVALRAEAGSGLLRLGVGFAF